MASPGGGSEPVQLVTTYPDPVDYGSYLESADGGFSVDDLNSPFETEARESYDDASQSDDWKKKNETAKKPEDKNRPVGGNEVRKGKKTSSVRNFMPNNP